MQQHHDANNAKQSDVSPWGSQQMLDTLHLGTRSAEEIQKDRNLEQEDQRRNIIFLKAAVETLDGTVTAEATAKFAVVSLK